MTASESNKPNAETAFDTGNPSSFFTPNEGVHVFGDLFPVSTTVDIYIVPDKGWANGDAIGTDVGDGIDSVTTEADGSLDLALIWSPDLGIGKYDVVIDTNRNGVYDYETDAVIGEGGVGFEVNITPGLYANTVVFTCVAPDNGIGISQYKWDFGDGNPVVTSINNTYTKTFDQGTYYVSCTVVYGDGSEIVYENIKVVVGENGNVIIAPIAILLGKP
jgi:hypothetical protein